MILCALCGVEPVHFPHHTYCSTRCRRRAASLRRALRMAALAAAAEAGRKGEAA